MAFSEDESWLVIVEGFEAEKVKQILEGIAAEAENAGGRGRGRGDRDCELMVLLPKWIIFHNILFLRKLFHVSLFVALEGERIARQLSLTAAAESLWQTGLRLTWKTSWEKARQALMLKAVYLVADWEGN